MHFIPGIHTVSNPIAGKDLDILLQKVQFVKDFIEAAEKDKALKSLDEVIAAIKALKVKFK